MKQKLLSVLLVLAMALTMLPTAAFAEETATPAVSGYGFVWKGGEHSDLVEGATTSGDWMDETMYVYFAEAPAANVNLWFQVKVGEHTWGCAASGGNKTYAFSFLNRGTQWELHPTINGESFDYNGNNVTHATKYMNAGKVTLEVFTPAKAIEGEQKTAPSADALGTAIFTQEITIAASTDVKETVDSATSGKKLGAGTVSGAILNQAIEEVKDITVTAKAGTADSDGVIPVALTASATIPTHKNGENKNGVWVGFALAAPEGAAKVKYAFSPSALNASSTLTETELEANVAGNKSGIAFYANKSDESPKIYAAVQWIPAENDTTHTASDVTVYKMDLSEINKSEAPVDPPTEGTLKFAALSDNFIFSGMGDKAVSDLVETGLKVSEPDANKVVKVTGIAKYAAWAEFNGNTEDKEQEGHYLPIQIKGVVGQKITIMGTKPKEFTFGSDGSCELAMFLDKLTGSKFTVTVGEVETSSKKAGDIYTIDLSGVTLLPKTAEDTTVESKPGQDGSVGTVEVSKGGNKVVIPGDLSTGTDSDKVELGQMIVKVDAVKNNANVAVDEDTPADVKTAIKGNDSKIVEVTIREVNDADAEGTEKNLFNDEAGLPGNKQITVTISGLTDGVTYHVFCIKDDGSVSYYGYETVSGTTLDVKTSHLCHFAAVKETDAVKEAVKTMAVEPNTGLEGSAGGTVTPPTTTSTYTRITEAALNKVTINGKAGTYYVVQATNAKNSAPGLIYCIKADATTGKAEVRCNASSVLLVLEGTTTEPVFTNGIPNGLTEVKEATKG